MSDSTQSIADYLAQLLKDKKQIAAFPNVFLHVERLLDEEIAKVRSNLFQINGIKKEPLVLPDASGPSTTLTEKVYVPVKEHPDFNFVGRILGPRGMTAKQLEQETGCKIMVRGRGSMRDKKKEEQNRGKPNWEHLNDELHVLITVEDTENRAKLKLQRAVDEVKRLLIPADGEDELKKRQLMELAIINGTYRDSSIKSATGGMLPDESSEMANRCARSYCIMSEDEWRCLALVAAAESQRLMAPNGGMTAPALRTPPTPLGAPLILSPRMQVPNSAAATHLLNGGQGAPQPLMSPADGLIYTPYTEYANYAASLTSPLLTEYTAEHAAGAAAKQRRHLGQLREHPYQRAGAMS
ncbi:protein held out wings isoform X2 [Neocloeon triangulifer]|uniref:protein held out wings isoform X2 n=1 Tax=Neocloeon triangulifer TaxID=2078957 RepID=UPI00286F71E5|nr:protein held out wings isoform X2 [Neocloeon triangulifer]